MGKRLVPDGRGWKLVDYDEPTTVLMNSQYFEFPKPAIEYSALIARSFARNEVVDTDLRTLRYGLSVREQPRVQLFKQSLPLPDVQEVLQPSLKEQARRAMEARMVTYPFPQPVTCAAPEPMAPMRVDYSEALRPKPPVTFPLVEQPTTYALPGVSVYESRPRRTLINRILGSRAVPAKPTPPMADANDSFTSIRSLGSEAPVQPMLLVDHRKRMVSGYMVTGHGDENVTTNVLFERAETRPASWAPPGDPRAAIRQVLASGPPAGVPLVLRTIVGATNGTTMFGLLGATADSTKATEARRAGLVAFMFTWIEAMCGDVGRRIVVALRMFTDVELEPLAAALAREVLK